MRVAALWPLLLALGSSAFGQLPTLRVYSALQRIDPTGRVVEADRARRADVGPREILSPGLARNSRTAFHVAVTVPPDTEFTLYVGQNPEGYLGVRMYKEAFVNRDAGWIPDGLEPVELPYTGRLPEAARPIAGQTTVVFLMDVSVPSGAEVLRTKLEPELHVKGQWIIYPMEVRILAARIPEGTRRGGATAGVDQPADTAARSALRSYLCGAPPGEETAPAGIRGFLLRDALQDMALARSLESPPGARLFPEILKPARGDGKMWCESPQFPEDLGPEWYLRLRDALLRMVE
ncbi:MAG TPA: hypothetical protein VLH09_15215 [Bryobacteraceae bacterium]|nr:hypothetical protein [Bryobacteraceae bacterium]